MSARAKDAEVASGGMKVLSCVRDVLTTRIQKERRREVDNGYSREGTEACPFCETKETEMAKSGCVLSRVLRVISQWSVGVAAQAP